MDFKLNKGSCCMGRKGCSKIQNNKLNTYDWLCDVPDAENATDYVEVQFKNTRKGYYLNSAKIPLEKGDMVAVEASPGYDIGTVTLTGKLVLLQMKKNNTRTEGVEIKKVYRKVKPSDIKKYEEAKAKEHTTMIRSRQIAAELGLNMKIGDVEYQGDGNKAIFYYIADERVDFRQLIKVLAEAFRVRIEMKQIGARQEVGRIGGIGPCGRELCCSSWMTSFVSVATGTAHYQDISMNPQKLAGQCAKLKCCINYEVDTYVEALKFLPSREVVLETKDNTYYHFKTEIFKKEITYSTDKTFAANLVTISAKRAFEVINMNKKGNKPATLEADNKPQQPKQTSHDILGQDSLTRFDSVKKKKKKKGNGGNNGGQPGSKEQQVQNNNSGNNSNTRSNRPARNEQKQAEGVNPGNNKNPNKNPNRPTRNKPRKKPTAEKRPNIDKPQKRLTMETTNRRIKSQHFWLLSILFLFTGCTASALYDQYQAIENATWKKNKEYYFTFYVEDISIPYNLSFEVRNNNRYPYQNLWLFYQIEQPIGPLVRDTIECMLADEFGKWYGNGISLFQSSFPILENHTFTREGQYTFSFRQGMHDNNLKGIQEIGFRVAPTR